MKTRRKISNVALEEILLRITRSKTSPFGRDKCFFYCDGSECVVVDAKNWQHFNLLANRTISKTVRNQLSALLPESTISTSPMIDDQRLIFDGYDSL